MTENHHIEEFFKKRLEAHEFPFQEEDWQLLERRLGATFPSPAGIFLTNSIVKNTIIILAAMTAAFFLGWLARDFINRDPHSQEPPGNKDTYQSEVMIPEKSGISDPPFEKYEITRRPLPGTNPQKETGNPVFAENNHETPLGDFKTETEAVTPANKEDLLSESSRELNPDISHPYQEESKVKNERDFPKPLNPVPSALEIPFVTLRVYQPVPASLAANKKPDAQLKIPFKNRWMIGFMFAPDYNSVTLFHNQTISGIIGGQLSYSFNPRWSVSAGVLYSNKKYTGEAEYYKMPEGYWLRKTNGIIPQDISGSCRVIDIPVLATYQVLRRERLILTASAGLGSYFLLGEQYDFRYAQDNPGAATHWQTIENSHAIFSIANFNVGVEFQTTRKTRVGVEPYIKIPLKQIGWGNINLYGAGLMFSIKYRL